VRRARRRGPGRRRLGRRPPGAPRAGAARLELPEPPTPTAQYVQAVRAGTLLFVAGHDPEAGGRLVFRGRVARDLDGTAARAAARLTTANALASARSAIGSLARIRRCVALTCFVDAEPGALDPTLVNEALALLADALGPGSPPVLCLRPAQGLAGGMPVEVELLLELGSGHR
jgi:enamine deaminase RidA (YjgF/YER057c/UK114 family)